MAIIASASITLANIRDVKATYRYYKLQASTAAAPGKPTSISTLPPSGWSSTEPSYTAGSTNTLYTVDLTTFTDGTFSYSPVSVSSSYEAAKQAFNLAATAQKSADSANSTANTAKSAVDNLQIGGRNLALGSQTYSGWKYYHSDLVDTPSYEGCKSFKIIEAWAGPYLNLKELYEAGKIKAGETLTYSIMVMANYAVENARLVLYRAQAEYKTAFFDLEKDVWQQIAFTFTVDNTTISSSTARIEAEFWDKNDPYYFGNNRQNCIYFSAPKLERGSKATDWTPAPEDQDAATASAASAASKAQSAADSANTAAGKAQTTADNANTAAGKAQTTADNAQKSAEEAAKTATNYLSYSETDGLIISEDASTADGWNTQIKSDGLHIRDGETSVADYGDGIKLYTPPDSNGNVTEAVAIDADGININKGKINLSAGESKIDQSCFSSTSADGKTSMYLNNYCVDFFRNETGAATTRIDEPFQEAALNYDGLTLTDNAIQPDDSTYMKDLYITTDHMMYEEGSSQYRINWLDLYKAINLTVKDLTSSVKGNLGGNTTAGNVGSFFSVVKIGKLVICSLNIQMKKNSTSKLGIIYGLPKAAYPANGALSYNGYSSSINIFIRAGERIIYNDGTIPYDGFVEGQLIYITSE